MNNHNIHLVLFLTFAILLGTASCSQTDIPTATLAPTTTPAPTLQPGDLERSVIFDGQERNYLLHIPPGMNSQQPAPLVFVFHGIQGSIA